MGWTALVDACVLCPVSTRDLLLRGAERYLYGVRWSQQIILEVRRNLIRNGRCTADQAAHLEEQLLTAFPDAMVTGYEPLVSNMDNHPDDRHVLAAAIAAGADVIVTDNVPHFALATIEPYGIEVQTADELLAYSFDLAPRVMGEVFLQQADDFSRPAFDTAAALAALQRRLPMLAARLRTLPAVRARRRPRIAPRAPGGADGRPSRPLR